MSERTSQEPSVNNQSMPPGGKPGRSRRPGAAKRAERTPADGQPRIARQDNPGWTIFSYLLGGMAVYGGIGWLIGRWAGHQPIFLAVGMLIGLALAITLTILRYGRS